MKRIRVILFATGFSLVMWACGSGAKTAEPTSIPPLATSIPLNVPIAYAKSDHCLDCHSDKQQLIDTAKPEEVVEKESTGAG